MKFFLCSFPLIIFSTLFFSPTSKGQSLVWQKKMISSFGEGQAAFLDSKTAADGKVYSVGFFKGEKAVLGNLELWADTSGIVDSLAGVGPTPRPYIIVSGFIACQDANGNFIWGRTVNGDHGFFQTIASTFLGKASKIYLDPSGNLYVSGQAQGNKATLNNIPFYQSTPPNPAEGRFSKTLAYVLKLSNQGNLLWSKVYHAENEVDPVYLGMVDGKIEAVFQHTGIEANGTQYRFGRWFFGGPTDTLQFLHQKFSPDGIVEAGSNLVVHFPGANEVAGRTILKRYSSHSWCLGVIRNTNSNHPSQMLLNISQDFTTITDSISFRARSAGINRNVLLVLNDIVELPDAKKGLIFSCINSTDGDEQLIWGTDTLDLNLPALIGGNKGFYLKVDGISCAKQITVLPDVLYLGRSSDQNPSGNFFTLNSSVVQDSTVRFKQFDQNGNLLSTLQAGNLASAYSYSNYEPIPGESFNHFSIQRSGNYVFVSSGDRITKVEINEVSTSDGSFQGCLSNGALLTNVQKQIVKPDFLFAGQNGIVFRQSGEGEGQYKLLNCQGKAVASGNLSGKETLIGEMTLPKGVYLLKVAGKDKQSTYRVIL